VPRRRYEMREPRGDGPAHTTAKNTFRKAPWLGHPPKP